MTKEQLYCCHRTMNETIHVKTLVFNFQGQPVFAASIKDVNWIFEIKNFICKQKIAWLQQPFKFYLCQQHFLYMKTD